MSHESLVDAVESSLDVKRRYQFFIWSQSRLNAVIPHQLVICGAYQRSQRQLAFDAFNGVVMEAELLGELTAPRGTFQQQLQAHWLAGAGRPLILELGKGSPLQAAPSQGLHRAGLQRLLVHGVSRPQRPAEIETLFIIGQGGKAVATDSEPLGRLGLLTPHLHATWLRVLETETEVGAIDSSVPPQPVPRRRPHGITERERQILGGLREGLSNQQVGELLGISPLTVKNHVQKILRKLDASNRAQAVARALALQMLDNLAPLPSAAESSARRDKASERA